MSPEQQQPADAIAVLDQFLLEGRHPDGGGLLLSEDSINLYLLAGARGEARSAINARLEKAPDDPYAGAVEVELDCWDAASFGHGEAAAARWLDRLGSANPGLQAYVQTRADWLSQQQEQAATVSRAEIGARLAPALGALVALVLCAVILKRSRALASGA